MDFILNDDQRMLADTVARFVDTEYNFEARRKRLTQPLGYTPALWDKLADMGLFALNVPAEHGGIGGGPVETMLVMQQFGRGLVLEPYLDTGVLAPRLIAQYGSAAQQARFMPAVAEGSVKFALAALEPSSRFDLDEISTRAEAQADGSFVISGSKAVVACGDSADWLIVSARSGSGEVAGAVTLFLVDARAAGVGCQGFGTIDHRRTAEVTLQQVRVPANGVIGKVGGGFALLEWTVDQGLAALAAEATGAMEKLTELTCEYLATRQQFGKPIGSFQALQHRAADMMIAVEQVRALAHAAAAKVDGGDRVERRRAAAAAKALAGSAGRRVGEQATQLHGGMGMTDEMASGHYFKRLTAIDMTLGDSHHHLEQFGEFL